MNFKLKSSIFSLTLISVCTATAFAATTTSMKENLNQSAVDAYWTPERLQNAKPMPMPKADPNKVVELSADQLPKKSTGDSGDGKGPEIKSLLKIQKLYTPRPSEFTPTGILDHGSSNEEFSSTRLIPVTADLSYPYRTVGKLFFTIPGKGDYLCSASVIRPRVILTAGHCVHEGSGGKDGFYTNWKFVPAYRDGTAPLETWTWSYVAVTNTWATGNGAVPNAADYAMIELKDNDIDGKQTKIGSVTGYLGYQTLSLFPNHTNMIGYPCNFDRCEKMHQVTAQGAKVVAPNNAEYGSDMAGGSSGGPWVQNFGELADGQNGALNSGLNRVVGITSYGYVSSNPKAQGAAIFDSRFKDMLDKVCAHKEGNCP